MEKVTLTTRSQAMAQKEAVVDVPVVEVTSDPIVTSFTEKEVDQQIMWTSQRIEEVSLSLEKLQADLEKWNGYKEQFPKEIQTNIEK